MGEESGLNLGGAAEGLGKGVEHTLNGVGTLAERINGLTDGCFLPHKASKQIEAAKVRAEGAISVLESVGITPTENDRRASAFFAMREIKGFENIEETLALTNIPEESHVSDIEDEWLSEFLDAASKAFSNWKRRMLANVVSEKALHPDCISMDALFSIAKMEEHHMDVFEKVCALRPTVDGKKSEPIILAMDDDLLETVGLNAKDLRSLQSIGLMREASTRMRKKAVFDERFLDRFDRSKCQFCAKPGKATISFDSVDVEVPIIRIEYCGFDNIVSKKRGEAFVDYGFIEFTEPGRELASLSNPPVPQGIEEYLTKGLKIVQEEENILHPHIAFAEKEYSRAIMKLINEETRRSLR